jgi:DHA1 family tetracycline resistance protein-like MFS transporter
MNPSLIWIAAALFTWGIGEGMFYMFQPFYLTELGANPVTIGYILGGAGLAMMIAHVPAGYLSDRIGRRPMLITAWIFGVTSTWIMALAPSLPFFVAGLLLYGVTAFVSSPLNSYITTARGSWSVGRALTLSSATFNLGMVLGPFTGGWIGQHYGLRSVYFVAGVLFLFSSGFVFLIAPQARERHDPTAPGTGLLNNRRYLGFLALGWVVVLAMYLPQPFTPKFLQDVRGLSLEQIGLLGAIGGLGNTVITFLIGFFDARLGFILSQVSVGLYSGIIWKMNGYGWFASAYFLLGGYRAARSLFMAQIRPLVKQSQMGLAYGIAESVLGFTSIIAPVIAGFLYQQDKGSIFPLAFFSILTVIMISFFFAPRSIHEELPLRPETME